MSGRQGGETLVWPALGNACVEGAWPASVINKLHDELNHLEEAKSRDSREKGRKRKREIRTYVHSREWGED